MDCVVVVMTEADCVVVVMTVARSVAILSVGLVMVNEGGVDVVVLLMVLAVVMIAGMAHNATLRPNSQKLPKDAQ